MHLYVCMPAIACICMLTCVCMLTCMRMCMCVHLHYVCIHMHKCACMGLCNNVTMLNETVTKHIWFPIFQWQQIVDMTKSSENKPRIKNLQMEITRNFSALQMLPISSFNKEDYLCTIVTSAD